MAYDVTKLTRLSHLKALAQRAEAKYATKKSVTELSVRVDELVTAGGEPNVLNGVKVNGTALNIAEKMVNIVLATGTENGTFVAKDGETVLATVAIKGLAALAYKANVSESDLDTALKAVITAKAEQTDVDNLQNEFNTLKGSGTGSVADQITAALNKFATDVTNDGVVNSYKELIDYAAEHGSEFTELVGKVNALIAKVDTGDKTVTAYVADQITKIGIGDYAKTTEVESMISTAMEVLDNYVVKEEGKRLMTDVEGTKLSGIAEGATKVEASEVNGNVKINGTETKVYTLPSDVIQGAIASDDEVNEMLAECIPAVAE